MGVCYLWSHKFCLRPLCASVSSSGMWVSEPPNPQHTVFTASPSLSGRALDSLTPLSARGKSPLHCHPSPWPGGRGSHHSARLSCPESSLARRWSALSHGGSVSRGNGQTSRHPAENPRASPDTPALVPPNQPSLHFGRVIRQQNLTKGVHHLPFQKCTRRK